MSAQKPLKLDADAFCVSYASLPELNRLPACQRASIEAQKIAPGIRVVCVPKG